LKKGGKSLQAGKSQRILLYFQKKEGDEDLGGVKRDEVKE